jgi:hypothetical protein
MFGKIKLIDLGRGKFNGEVTVKNEDQLWKEIKKHVMSNDVEYFYDEEKNWGTIYAGFHAIGNFEVVHAARHVVD